MADSKLLQAIIRGSVSQYCTASSLREISGISITHTATYRPDFREAYRRTISLMAMGVIWNNCLRPPKNSSLVEYDKIEEMIIQAPSSLSVGINEARVCIAL